MKNSTASTPTRLIDSARAAVAFCAASATAGITGAGATLRARMPFSWRFCDVGKCWIVPSVSRASSALISPSKPISSSRMVSSLSIEASAVARSSPGDSLIWPLPSYPMRQVFRMALPLRASIASVKSSRLRTCQKRGVGMPSPVASVFSAMRCCAACRAAAPGLARHMAPITSIVAAGTFSNSLVTASTLRAKLRSALASS